jgi:hypothetical protein
MMHGPDEHLTVDLYPPRLPVQKLLVVDLITSGVTNVPPALDRVAAKEPVEEVHSCRMV